MSALRAALDTMVEWLTRRRALAQARAAPGATRRVACLREAEKAALAGDELGQPSLTSGLGSNSQPLLALALYRQSATLACVALLGDLDEPAPTSLEDLLGHLAGSDEHLAGLLREHFRLAGAPPLLPPLAAEQHREVRAARAVLESLLVRARRACPLPRLERERTTRLLLALLLPIALLGALGLRLRPRDLAARAPWHTSSTDADYPGQGRGTTDRQGSLLFHTDQEDSPFIVFDLQSDQFIRTIEVVNRADCCGERALPLVIELSADGTTWREVVRRTKNFATWKARIGQTARFVRLRSPHRTWLHLEDVRIH